MLIEYALSLSQQLIVEMSHESSGRTHYRVKLTLEISGHYSSHGAFPHYVHTRA